MSSEIQLRSVKSSKIRAAGYSPEQQVFVVEYKSGVRDKYFDVPPSVDAEFWASESKGKYHDRYIHGVYRHERSS